MRFNACNFQNGKSLVVTNAAFVLEPTVAALKGPLNTLIPEIEQVNDRLQKELFEPVSSLLLLDLLFS